MRNGHTANRQSGRVCIQPVLDPVWTILFFPSTNAPFLAGRAFVLDDAIGAGTRPIRSDGFAVLWAGEPVGQVLACGADMDIEVVVTGEVSLLKLTARRRV